jgi:glycosyltransferase involved in cell wall biosynthesis
MFGSHINRDRALAEPSLEKVDVIIPVKNAKGNWKKCLDSFYREIPINQLLIGDGGCTDNTIEIVRKYPRAKVFDHSKFKTLGFSIRRLIEKVGTEWFVYLHSDVSLPHGWYDEMCKYRTKWMWFECKRIGVYADGTKRELVEQYEAQRAYSGSQMGKSTILKEAVKPFDDDYIQRTEDIIIMQNVEKLGYEYGKVPTTFHYHYITYPYAPTLSDALQTAQAIIKYLSPSKENTATVRTNIVKLAQVGVLTNEYWKEWTQKTNPVWLVWIPVSYKGEETWAVRLLSRAKEIYKERGIRYVTRAGVKRIHFRLTLFLGYYYYKTFESRRTFIFQGKTYRYFYHNYNRTWRNERAVEVPIVWQILKKYEGKNILEVGNVLSHYFSVSHDIIDKYEKIDSVISHDAVDFNPPKRYDLIVSISTLEHIGWDEILRDSTKIPHTIENLERLLAPKGKMIVTLPLGYNPELDKLLGDGKIQFTRRFCLKRVSKDNKWMEADWKEVKNARYDGPFPYANGLVIGIIEKSP